MEYNPFSDAVQADPYPIYRWLRDEAPCYYDAELDFYALSRFEDVWNATLDWRTYSSALGPLIENKGELPGEFFSVLGMDPPRHTRIRNLVSRGFTPRRIAALEPAVRSLIVGYLDRLAELPREAVRIEFDNARVSYDELAAAFFHSVDPTDGGGQFCDRGHSYTTAVYAVGDAQLASAEKAKKAAAKELKQELATEIVAAPEFWPAEDYHQDYYKKNPLRYKYYRNGCGRDARLEQVWGENALKGINKGS